LKGLELLIQKRLKKDKPSTLSPSSIFATQPLLSPFDIGLEIPARLTNLIQLSKHFNWVDGPQAIAEIRNAIVHPNSKNRHKRSSA